MPFTTAQSAYPIAIRVGQLVQPKARMETAVVIPATSGTTRLLTSAVSTATTTSDYTIRGRMPGEEWVSVTFTTSSTSATALRDGLVAAWNADPVLRGWALSAAASAGTAINWTGIGENGGAFEVEIVANPGSALGTITVTTAGAANAETAFGTYVLLTSAVRTSNVRRFVSSSLSALAGDVVTFSATYSGSETFDWSINVDIPGVGPTFYSDSAVAVGANLAAMLAALVASLEAALGDVVTVDTSSPDVTVTFPIGYGVITVASSASGSAALTSVKADGDSVPNVALVYDDDTVAPTAIGSTVTGYPATTQAAVVLSGADVAVADPGDSPTLGGIVWIETAAGSTNGLPYGTATASRFPHPTHRWQIVDDVSPGLAIIGA